MALILHAAESTLHRQGRGGTPAQLLIACAPARHAARFFKPDSVGGVKSDSTKTCAISGTKCTISPRGSGTLHLWAMVNGKLVHKTSRVNVVPCPTGDTLLDEQVFRNSIAEMTSRIKKSDPTNNRREEGSTIFWNQENDSIRIDARSPGNACSFNPGLPLPNDTYPWRPIRMVHTHPYWKGESVQHCAKNGVKANPFDPLDNGGFSNEDWNTMYDPGAQVDSYVITPEWWFRGHWYPLNSKQSDKYDRRKCKITYPVTP